MYGLADGVLMAFMSDIGGFFGGFAARRGFSDGGVIGRNGAAAAMLMAHALIASWLPAFVALGGAGSPFLFSCVMTVAETAGLALALAIWRPSLFFSRHVWRAAIRKLINWPFAIWTLGYLDVAALAWAARFGDISVVTILYYLSPLMFVLCVQWMFSGEARYRRMGAMEIGLFAMAFAGAALAIASQADGIDLGGGAHMALGATLAIGGAALAAVTSVGFRWGVDLAKRISRGAGRAVDLEIYCCLVGMIFCGAILAPLTLALGIARGEALDGGVLWAGVGAGLLTGAIASLLWRSAMLIASDLGVAAIRYLMPVASLGWLLALGLIGDVDLRLLGLGAALIVCANAGMGWRVRGRGK